MNHPSHKTRFSDASSFDEICTECGATDRAGSDKLKKPCKPDEDYWTKMDQGGI